MILHILQFILILNHVLGQCNKWDETVSIATQFLEIKLVPDLIGFPPRIRLLVTLAGEDKTDKVKPGGELSRLDLWSPPKSFSWLSEIDAYYTFFMSTPDHPIYNNASAFRTYHHWLICNIPGDDITKGQVMINYTKPNRYPGIGYCRYAFLVYKQPRPIPVPKKSLTGDDVNFTCTEFATKFNLGDVWAGNYFFIWYE